MLCFVVVMQSFIMNSHEGFIHIHQGCFAGTGAIVRMPQCQWSKPDGYGKISQCITTTKHSKAKTVCIFLGIYCNCDSDSRDVNDTFAKRKCHKEMNSWVTPAMINDYLHNQLLTFQCLPLKCWSRSYTEFVKRCAAQYQAWRSWLKYLTCFPKSIGLMIVITFSLIRQHDSK